MLRRELPNGYALRLLEESDADELFSLIDANREHLEPWMPWVPEERSPDDVLAFIRLTRKQIADNDGFHHAFGAWKLNRVTIEAAVDNARSRALPERLGFTHEGTLRGAGRVGARTMDHAVYAVLADEWKLR